MDAGGARHRSERRKTRLVPISAVLGEYLADSGLDSAFQRVTVLEEWPGLVGPRIAAVTRPLEVRGETLVVEVSSSPWLNELTMMRHEILERINQPAERPPMQRILFRLAEGTGRARTPEVDDTN